MLQQEIPIKTSIEAAKIARQKGKLVVWDPAPASKIPDQVYELAQIMLPNQIEAEYLTGTKIVDVGSAEKAANIFLNKGVEFIVIKMGSQGAFYATGSNRGHIPAFKVDVKDTVAAGDAFGAGFTYSYLNSNNFEEAVKFGVAAGCLSTTLEGAMDSMPFIDSVIKLVN